MCEIKAGDLVRRINHIPYEGVKKGDVVRVTSVTSNGRGLRIEGKSGTHSAPAYEKVEFNLRADPWFIRVNKDTLPLARAWLIEKGLKVGDFDVLGIKYLTNTIKDEGVQLGRIMWGQRDDIEDYADEIKLTFGIIGVEFPKPPALTAEELELIELRKQLETISERMKQLEK